MLYISGTSLHSRPPSSLSQRSGSVWNNSVNTTVLPTGGAAGALGTTTTTDEGIGSTLATTMGGESMKLSLLAKAKAVEEQVRPM